MPLGFSFQENVVHLDDSLDLPRTKKKPQDPEMSLGQYSKHLKAMLMRFSSIDKREDPGRDAVIVS